MCLAGVVCSWPNITQSHRDVVVVHQDLRLGLVLLPGQHNLWQLGDHLSFICQLLQAAPSLSVLAGRRQPLQLMHN